MFDGFLLFLGKCLNLLPQCIMRFFCTLGGYALYYGLRSRRRILLHNLYIVFPKQSESLRRYLARLNCCRWVETVWLFLVSASWSKAKISKHVTLSPGLKNWIQTMNKTPHPAVVLVPHLNLMEAMTWIPSFFDTFPNTGIVYRPYRSKRFENFVKRTRERFGLQLISRRRGVAPLEKILRDRGIVGVLFDQSAGATGCLTTFCGRLASCTDLPGKLVEKFSADTVIIYMKRTDFLRGELCIEEISSRPNELDITLYANQWLEDKLKNDPAFFENWLWLHRRWKTQVDSKARFQINQKRNWLPETCKYFHWKQLPRTTQVWVRMPQYLGDCIMTYPLLLALRQARPDFYFHVLAKPAFSSLLQKHFPIDFIHTLPQASGMNYFYHFTKIQDQHPDLWLSFVSSERGFIEAFCSGALQRFGKKTLAGRLLMTDTFDPTLLNNEHQVEYWYRFFRNFGLKEPLSQEPLYTHTKQKRIKAFGCFCGSANRPAKRWPVRHWQTLIGHLLKQWPDAMCTLFGAAQDEDLSRDVFMELPRGRVRNLVNKTSLPQLEEELLSLDFVVANDSGGMHLSNFLGIPTVGVFGPTSPSFAGPFFLAPKCILSSPTKQMIDLKPNLVYAKILEWLEEQPDSTDIPSFV